MMRISILNAALAGLAIAVSAGAASAAGAPKAAPVTGDYVEARTASVFAGACHYNGELTTTGRDAEMVWHVNSGTVNGVDLSGLTVMAAVTAPDNLKDAVGTRRSVLYIDSRATAAQAQAITELMTGSYKAALGEIVAVKRVPVTYSRTSDNFAVDARGIGKLSVAAMPNGECCKQPNLVWYQPLVAIAGRKVGFTRESGIDDSALGASWSKFNQNTAFYGTFSIK